MNGQLLSVVENFMTNKELVDLVSISPSGALLLATEAHLRIIHF
jgi:hypothetical protein